MRGQLSLEFGDTLEEDGGSETNRLTIYRYLYDDSQWVRRFLEFVVVADLVLFAAVPWSGPLFAYSVLAVLVCVTALFFVYSMCRESAVAYREEIERAAGEDTTTDSERFVDRINGSPVEYLNALNTRAEGVVFTSLFVPALYHLVLHADPIFGGDLEASTGEGRVELARLVVVGLSSMLFVISWWAQRPVTRESLDIPPETDYALDRFLLFITQYKEKALSFGEQLPFVGLELVVSSIGLLLAVAGLLQLLTQGVSVPLVIGSLIGLYMLWPIRWLVGKITGVYSDVFEVSAAIGWMITGSYAVSMIGDVGVKIGPNVDIVFFFLTSPLVVYFTRYLQHRYTWI